MNLEDCQQTLQFAVPFLISVVAGAFSIGVWMLWDEWKLKREEALEVHQRTPEPLEVEEIPRQNLYFQKLALQIHRNSYTDYQTGEDALHSAMEWMIQNKHLNQKDLEAVLEVLESENTMDKELYEAQVWMETAFYVWSKEPTWIMPAWSPLIIRRNRSWTMQ